MIRHALILANLFAPAVWVFSGFDLVWLGVMFAVHMLTLYATLVPGCSWWGPVQCTLPRAGDAVWITVDDGPDGVATRAAMDLLEEAGARATFFLIVRKAESDPDLVREIGRRGHGVGSHTSSHPARAFWRHGPRRLWAGIGGGGRALGEILGSDPKLFRAPAGMRNFFVHPLLRELGLPLVAWSARGFDGSRGDIDRIVGRIARRLKPGAIVLLHESRRGEKGSPLLLDVLPRVLAAVREKGLGFVSPDDALKLLCEKLPDSC